jgi:putative ABC transport system permease protein
MQLGEIISEGWTSLMRNRMRSILSMLGIVWGLVTVVLLLGYGQGVGISVLHAFTGIGDNVIMIWGGQTSMHAAAREPASECGSSTKTQKLCARKCPSLAL